MTDLKNHLVAELQQGIGFSEPFELCYFRPFPYEFYPSVLENLPATELYKDLPHEDAMRANGTSTRLVLPLNDAPLFWQQLSDVLCSSEVERAFRVRLGFNGRVRAVTRLFRDFAGYKIAPHQDSSKKACTVQLYLASDDGQASLGTSFYYKHDEGLFREEKKLAFLPNTGYGFKVTDNSWHGMSRCLSSRPRDSLILTYYRV